jgi:putative transcriptional regulator
MTKETKQAFDDRFAAEMTEAADGMLRVGVMSAADHKLTMRDLRGAPPEETVSPLTGPDIRGMRERANLSQAVFARYLNLTVDHVSKLERGAKHPTGPALVLLNVIRRKGIEAIL